MTRAIPLERVNRHGAATIVSTAPLIVQSSPVQWDYAVSVPLAPGAAGPTGEVPMKVFATVNVEEGELGCMLVGGDWTTLLGGVPPAAGRGRHTVELLWERPEACANLVFRNHTAHHQPCLFRVESVALAPAPPDAMTGAASDVDVLGRLREKWSVVPAGTTARRSTTDLLALSDDALRELWLATHREAATGETGFRQRGWYQAIYRDVLRGKKVLEIGSGMGIDGIEFARHGAEMTFVDIVDANLALMRRLCEAFGVTGARFVHLDRLAALDALDADYDVAWCQGSLINAPFDFMKDECARILEHLKVGGRWIELCYPKERWERDGAPPFRTWGTMTDGEGTPWVEWYDLDKLLQRLAPARFTPLLAFNFHDDDFNWFDLVRVE